MADDQEDLGEEYIPEGGIHIDDIYIPPPPPAACTFEATGARLIITHIENEFFKSYAGKQVLGPFHKSFTSIVGPNGSGKSNVIDSMLFVFGYRGQKIRSKKISALIHNSEQHPNVNSCKVAVHFQEITDKDDDFEVVSNSQFTVTRTAFKDNTSYYQVNGAGFKNKRVQFKEVGQLLRTKGIDLDHNRFLILQGEVEQISLMKPKGLTEHDTGMLEYLEDIVGTSRFKTPIELLSKRVEDLNELRVEKLNRVKLVEKEKDELEGPMNEALGFLRLENEKVKKINQKNQRHIVDAEKNITKASEKKAEIEASVSDLSEKLKNVHDKKKEKADDIKKAGKEFEQVNKNIDELSEKFKKCELEDTSLREDLKNTNVKRKKLMQLAKLEREKQEKFTAVPEENKAKIEECTEHRDKLEEKVAVEEKNYETAMSNLKQETQVFQDEKEKHETKLVGLKKDVNETEGVLTLAKNELEIYTSAEQKEKIRLDQITNSIKTTQDKVKEKVARLSELETDIPEKEREVVEKEKNLVNVSSQLEEVQRQLAERRLQFHEKKSAQQASKSHGRTTDALMQQKNNGNIPGIIGRLGDLGAIDKKYDVAVSTAGGGSLDTIITDTVDTAKACIEFLKRSDMGRANFLALDKTYRWKEKAEEKIQTPMNAPRLFDLITVQDGNIKTAFYHYLRDTLVADDMEQATKIAYGARRYRTVTLGGELIETSGTMSGGGRNKISGKMGQQVAAAPKISPKELEKMERGIEESAGEQKDLVTTRQGLEDGILKFKRDVKELKKQESKLKVEVNPLKDQLEMLKRQVEDQKNKVKEAAPDKNRVKELTKNMKEAEKKYEVAAAASEEVEQLVKECDGKIKEITGGKIKAVRKKLDDSKNQLEKMKTEITRLTVEIKTAERNLKKCNDKVEGLDAEVKECEDGMRGMTERRTEIEKEGSVILDETQTFKTKSQELSELISEKKKEHDSIEKEELELKSSRIEVDQDLDKWNDVIKENQKKVAFWKRENKKMELHEVPGEDPDEFKEFTMEELMEINLDELEYELNVIGEKIAATKPNMAAIQEYKRKNEVYLERVAELDEMTAKRDQQRKHHDDLRKQRLNDFMEGFGIITGKLKEMYQMITLGGDAELELVDSLDPFTEGIVFSVRPPKKSWKNISNLSGGEKTLSSLALVFALHYYKPTPLYVMDEIDAALDFKNVSIVANYIKERTKNAQFIIISLRSNMFELADRLVGIYKTYNCTKTVTINPGLVGEEQENRPPVGQAGQENREPVAADRVRPPSASRSGLAPLAPSQNLTEQNVAEHTFNMTPAGT